MTDPQTFYILKQYFEIALMNQKTEYLNDLISTYLIKKKINVREIEVKLKNEELRKEKEELKIRKNLEDKIDTALEKANLCLNNIKTLGKITPVISKGQNPIKIKDLEKKDEKDPIDIIITKIKNKYNDKITINEENMNDYFFNITKLKNKFKSVKQKNRSLQNKAKNLKNIYSQIYLKSKKVWKPDNTTDFTFYKMINFNYIDLLYKLISIISTELFEKLFIKIMHSTQKNENKPNYNSNHENNQNSKIRKYKNENPNESEYMNILQDTFSFWYCLKFLLNLIESNQSLTNLNAIFDPLNDNAVSKNEKLLYNSLDIIEKYNKSDIFGYISLIKKIFKEENMNELFNQNLEQILNENVKKYLKFLNDKNLNKNQNINENEIFDKNYYLFYEYALMNIKLNTCKLMYNDLEKKSMINFGVVKNKSKGDSDNYTIQDLKLFKNLYSIIVNNSNFSYSIFKK